VVKKDTVKEESDKDERPKKVKKDKTPTQDEILDLI
jgi:hypothetical protein